MSYVGDNSDSRLTPKEEDTDLQKGFKIIGVVLIFLAMMVVLRFLVNCCIDTAVLGNPDSSLARTLSHIRRFVCPRWHPRTQPQDAAAITASPTNQESSTEMVNMDRLLAGLTSAQKEALLTSVLKSRVATKADLEKWKVQDDQHTHTPTKPVPLVSTSTTSAAAADIENNHDINSVSYDGDDNDNDEWQNHQEGGLLCPICIYDIEGGQPVVSLTSCNHRFHCQCLAQWLSTHTRDCPYCRTEIITQDMMDQAYEQKRNMILISGRLQQEQQQQQQQDPTSTNTSSPGPGQGAQVEDADGSSDLIEEED